jgi:hypothetical protein
MVGGQMTSTEQVAGRHSTGPTIYAGILALAIALALSFVVSRIPDVQLLGWPIAKVKQGLENVTWTAVLPMFFFFRTGLGRARSLAGPTRVPAESAQSRFWRYVFVTAFVLIAIIELLNLLMEGFVNVFISSLREAGLLGRDTLSTTADISKSVDIQIQTQTIVILPIVAFSALVVGWISHSLAIPRRILYLLVTMVVVGCFRGIEFALGLWFGLPAMISASRSSISTIGYVFIVPLMLFSLTLIGFAVRATIKKIGSILARVVRQPATT